MRFWRSTLVAGMLGAIQPGLAQSSASAYADAIATCDVDVRQGAAYVRALDSLNGPESRPAQLRSALALCLSKGHTESASEINSEIKALLLEIEELEARKEK